MNDSNHTIPDGRSPEATSGLAAKLRTIFLRSLIGSLVLAAAMGVYAFLLGQWGETEVRILLTTLSLSFCSMTALASATAFARGRNSPLAHGLSIAGVTVSIAAFLLFMGAIWLGSDFNEPYVKTMAIAGILSFSLGQACLLGLAPLPRHMLWVHWLTLCAIAALAAFNREPVDRVPTDFWATQETVRKLRDYLGDGVGLREALHIDGMAYVFPRYAGPYLPATAQGESVDIWGARTKLIPHQGGAYDEVTFSPLANAQTLDDLDAYAWPQADWFDYSTVRALAEKGRKTGKQYVVIAAGGYGRSGTKLGDSVVAFALPD